MSSSLMDTTHDLAHPRLSIWRHVSFSLYWFPISYLWAGLNAIILPVLVLRFVPETQKGTALALVAASGLLIAVIVQPMAGAASDVARFRWGRRRPFIVIGSLLDLVFLAGLALAPSYVALFLCYIGLQIASNIAHGPYQSLIPDQVPDDERGRASGFMGMSQVAGMASGLLISGYFVHHEQMGLALLAIGLTIIVCTILTIRLVPDTISPTNVKIDLLGVVRRTFDRDVFRYKDFVWLVISRFFILLGLDTTRDFAYFYLKDVLDMPNPAQAASQLMAITIFFGLITVLPAGYLSDRIGRKRLVIASASCGIVGGFLFLTSKSYNEILFYGILVGIGMGSFRSVDWAFATDLVPKSQAGRFLGISNIATAGAAAGSYILGGPTIDFFNMRSENQGYQALLCLVIAYLIIGTLAILKVREVNVIDEAPIPVLVEEKTGTSL